LASHSTDGGFGHLNHLDLVDLGHAIGLVVVANAVCMARPHSCASVLGFYLLVVMGPQGPLGQFTQAMGWGVLSFTFTGLLIGSILFSLPFAVQPLQHAFDAIGPRPMEVAATLRASPLDAFFSVALPLAKPGMVTAAILSFAHTVGEFGVVLMIGGNIPGQTSVVSTEIYGHVEAMEYAQAHVLAAGMLAFSFVVLLALALMNRRQRQVV
jgi:molybdate transport system permease protein